MFWIERLNIGAHFVPSLSKNGKYIENNLNNIPEAFTIYTVPEALTKTERISPPTAAESSGLIKNF